MSTPAGRRRTTLLLVPAETTPALRTRRRGRYTRTTGTVHCGPASRLPTDTGPTRCRPATSAATGMRAPPEGIRGTLGGVLTEDTVPATVGNQPSTATRVGLALEFLALFFGAITVFSVFADGVSPIPFLVVLGVASAIYLLRVREFDRRDLWRASAVRGQLPSILGLWAIACILAVSGVAVFLPDDLLSMPRDEPLVWAVVAVGYPVLSVYPQELIFRSFLFRRYAPVFGSGVGMIVASAAAFGFAHIIFGNLFAVVATAAGGTLFAWRYARSRSLLAVSIEHGLYGILLFTVGLGRFVYHGAG